MSNGRASLPPATGLEPIPPQDLHIPSRVGDLDEDVEQPPPPPKTPLYRSPAHADRPLRPDSAPRRAPSTFHFLAGLSSGLSTAVLLQPVDLLKTRVQQSHSPLPVELRKILKGPQPVRTLWRGTTPSALRTGFGSALYFASLNALREIAARPPVSADSPSVSTRASSGSSSSSDANTSNTSRAKTSSSLPRLSPTANLATGALARASVGFVMMPITVVKVRYESNLYAYRSLLGAGRDIVAKEGLKGFFAGWGATAIRDAPYAGLYVWLYEGSKHRLSAMAHRVPDGQHVREAHDSVDERKGMTAGTSVSINFVSGLVAASAATAMTNPFDAIKTRLQLMPRRYRNMWSAGKLMVREEGFRSLLDGLGLRMSRKAISSALAWTVYEEFVRRAEQKWVGD